MFLGFSIFQLTQSILEMAIMILLFLKESLKKISGKNQHTNKVIIFIVSKDG